MERYIVIGWDKRNQYNAASMGLFEVTVAKGETVKDVQDKVADLAEELFEHVIYTVVPREDYRQIWRDRLDFWFGGKVT